MPKVLLLRDLNWSDESYQITTADIALLREKQEFPKDPKFNRLKDYAEVIIQAKPQIVFTKPSYEIKRNSPVYHLSHDVS